MLSIKMKDFYLEQQLILIMFQLGTLVKKHLNIHLQLDMKLFSKIILLHVMKELQILFGLKIEIKQTIMLSMTHQEDDTKYGKIQSQLKIQKLMEYKSF